MNYLILMVGAPASGKSTFIKNMMWDPYTLSPDKIRLTYQSPTLSVNGNFQTPMNNDYRVWEYLMQMIEFRMQNGDTTIIDATHTKVEYFSKYKKLAEVYGYRMFAIDFRNVPIAKCLENNKLRLATQEVYKFVPEEAIHSMYENSQKLIIPNYVKVLNYDDLDTIRNTFTYRIHNYDKYDGITVIGDVHGCIDPINSLPDLSLKNWLYIFIGDYVDRGINNAEVLQYMMKVCQLQNVIALKGNHEIHLWRWATDQEGKSDEFNNFTKLQIESVGISKSDVKHWYKNLVPMIYFNYNNKKFLVTHGGISTIPDNLLFINNNSFIKGTGRYDNMEEVNDSFLKTTDENTYQIHGHRNINNVPIRYNDRCYNLEGKVEFGGYLRTLAITKSEDGVNIAEIEIPNLKVKPNIFPISRFNPIENKSIITTLLNSRDIRTKIQESNNSIVSFNFDKDVFYKRRWNDLNVKARGLFININTGKVVARSYDKFFNIGERKETSLDALYETFKYPVVAYKKENGFLGMLGYDAESDSLLFTSKSLMDGKYATLFKSVLLQYTIRSGHNSDVYFNMLKQYIKETNHGLVFEVIESQKDPHIIEQSVVKLVLLAAVNLEFKFKQTSYNDLCKLQSKFGFEVKKDCGVFNTQKDLEEFIQETYNAGTSIHHEGFVLEDANNFMVKYKTPYYKYWKNIRTQVQKYSLGNDIDSNFINDEFLIWLKNNYDPDKLTANINIPELRYEWLENKIFNKLDIR